MALFRKDGVWHIWTWMIVLIHLIFSCWLIRPAFQTNTNSSSSLMLNTLQLNINPCVSCYRTHSYVILISMLSVGTCKMLWKLCALMCSFFVLCAVRLDARYQKLTWFFSGVRRVTGTLKSKRSFGVIFFVCSLFSPIPCFVFRHFGFTECLHNGWKSVSYLLVSLMNLSHL